MLVTREDAAHSVLPIQIKRKRISKTLALDDSFRLFLKPNQHHSPCRFQPIQYSSPYLYKRDHPMQNAEDAPCRDVQNELSFIGLEVIGCLRNQESPFPNLQHIPYMPGASCIVIPGTHYCN
jgi:hypothetical protein